MNQFIDATYDALSAGNWYAAMTVALTLPDICAAAEDPGIGKSHTRYVRWFDRYVSAKYSVASHGRSLSGEDAYALRCAFLHQGEFDITVPRAKSAMKAFEFIAPRPRVVQHNNLYPGAKLQLQVDVFCKDVCAGVFQWQSDVANDPVIGARIDATARIATR
jgi:hypothetical protein